MVFKTHDSQDKDTVILDRKTRRVLGRFKDGLYETEDPLMIHRMMPHYATVETKKGRARKCQQTGQEE